MAKPPITPPPEWPVDDEDMEALCDAALDEPAYEAVERFVRGGSDDDEGFAQTLREARERSARLAAEVPNIRNILSARRRKAFLAALSQTGNITAACAAAGWSRGIPASLRKADRDFAEKWDFALETAADILELAAIQRAVHGVQEEKWQLSKEGTPVHVQTVTRYSDKLLELLLKGNKKAKYGGSSEADPNANKGGVLLVPMAPSFDEWSAQAAAQQAKFRGEGDQE